MPESATEETSRLSGRRLSEGSASSRPVFQTYDSQGRNKTAIGGDGGLIVLGMRGRPEPTERRRHQNGTSRVSLGESGIAVRGMRARPARAHAAVSSRANAAACARARIADADDVERVAIRPESATE
eukprot:2438410-Prymnesium_polylepis.1